MEIKCNHSIRINIKNNAKEFEKREQMTTVNETCSKMVYLKLTISIITLDLNHLSTSIKI